jgi:hypothetical protein
MKSGQKFLIRAACNSWCVSTSIPLRFSAVGVLVLLLTVRVIGYIHLPYLNSLCKLIRKLFKAHEIFENFLSVFAISVICEPFSFFSAFGIFSTLGVLKMCEIFSWLMVSETSLSVFATFYFSVSMGTRM